MSVHTDRGLEGRGLEDADIEEVARIRLQHSPYRALRRLGCHFSTGTLTLTGEAPTFHYKQLAQTTIAGIRGVTQIDNQIDVVE